MSMKRTVLTILSTIIGAALLLGGGAFGAQMYNASIPHFDKYEITYAIISRDGSSHEEIREMQLAEGYGVNYPYFSSINPYNLDIYDCYSEVESACGGYAHYTAYRYDNKARLDPEVECTKTRLTIKFTGYGVLEDGTREELDRTYIFDIEGVGRKKLPKLLNKAEIYPEIL